MHLFICLINRAISRGTGYDPIESTPTEFLLIRTPTYANTLRPITRFRDRGLDHVKQVMRDHQQQQQQLQQQQ